MYMNLSCLVIYYDKTNKLKLKINIRFVNHNIQVMPIIELNSRIVLVYELLCIMLQDSSWLPGALLFNAGCNNLAFFLNPEKNLK